MWPTWESKTGLSPHFVQDRFGRSGLQWVNSQKYFNLLNATLWGKVAFLAFRVHRGGGGGASLAGRVGEIGLQCVFFRSLKSTSC